MALLDQNMGVSPQKQTRKQNKKTEQKKKQTRAHPNLNGDCHNYYDEDQTEIQAP